jgi:hypothetical protein
MFATSADVTNSQLPMAFMNDTTPNYSYNAVVDADSAVATLAMEEGGTNPSLVIQEEHYVSNDKRIAIGCTGLIVGLVTYGPNIMMSDSGTRAAYAAASVGSLASLLFVIGGCVGACWGRWVALLPGVILQIAVFAIVPW